MSAPAHLPGAAPAPRPGLGRPASRRWLPVAAIVLLLLVTVIATVLLFDRRAEAAREDRDRAAAAAAGRVELALREVAAGLTPIGEVIRRGDPYRIDRGAFGIAAGVPLAAGAGVVHWAPRVDAADAERFRLTSGVTIRGAGPGAAAFPVLVSARAGERPNVPPGDDLTGGRPAAGAIAVAAATGAARAAPRAGGVIMIVPVYRGSTPGSAPARREALVGVAAAELTRADLIDLATAAVPLGAEVAVRTAPVPPGDGVSRLDLGGRTGAVVVGGLDPSPWPPTLLLAAGLAVAAMVGALFLLAASREREGRRSSEAVRRERDYSAAVMASIQDGLLLFDEQMRIVDVNERASEITGFTKRELEGRSPPFPFQLAADRRRLETILEEVRVLGVGEFDVPLIDKRQRPLQAILSLSVKRDRAGVIEGYVGTIKDITARKVAEQRAKDRERENRVLASEQRALREVATAVAREQEPEAVFALVVSQAVELAEGEIGMVLRIERGVPQVVASIPRGLRSEPRPSPESALGRALASGELARVRSARALDGSGGFSEAVVAPVRTGERIWGAVAVATRRVGLAPTAEDGVAGLAELIAMAIVNAQVRDRLTSEAATDPLTDLANRRTFDDRLASEVQRALRHERPLSLVMLDLDHFKAVNDVHGHQVGDEVLITVGQRISSLARVGELVARVGGEEFAWILTETDANGAFAAAERARGAIRGRPIAGIGRVTVSAGVCDLASAGSAAELFRLADAALYQAKASGRDLTRRHSDGGVLATAPAPSSALIRARARDGLNSLARRIGPAGADRPARADAVADLVATMATEAGWPVERVTRLREAARLYDLGLAGIRFDQRTGADHPGGDHETALRSHVEIGANIASEVLDPEQVEWIRRHHERWDGAGYPDGLAGERIPDGARLIAVADAWVRRTRDAPDGDAGDREWALATCRRQAGTIFAPEAVVALERALQAADLR